MLHVLIFRKVLMLILKSDLKFSYDWREGYQCKKHKMIYARVPRSHALCAFNLTISMRKKLVTYKKGDRSFSNCKDSTPENIFFSDFYNKRFKGNILLYHVIPFSNLKISF